MRYRYALSRCVSMPYQTFSDAVRQNWRPWYWPDLRPPTVDLSTSPNAEELRVFALRSAISAFVRHLSASEIRAKRQRVWLSAAAVRSACNLLGDLMVQFILFCDSVPWRALDAGLYNGPTSGGNLPRCDPKTDSAKFGLA